MKVSIREVTNQSSGLISLRVYRSRERAYSLPGGAHATKSGYWVLTIPGEPTDVVVNQADAARALATYWEAQL